MPCTSLRFPAARLALAITVTSALLPSCSTAPHESGRTRPSMPEAKTEGAPGPAAPQQTPAQAFAALSARFLDGYFQREPVAATEAGDHHHDARWPDSSAEGEGDARRFYAAMLDELVRIPKSDLGPEDRVDHAMLETQLRYAIFAIDELRAPEQSPLHYTRLIGDGLDPLISRSFATPEARAQSALGRLKGVPAIVEMARKRLARPPRLHTETAIAQNRGLLKLCRSDVLDAFAKLPDEKLVSALASEGARAAAALEDFQRFLEKDLLPRSDGEVRLGRARFEKKLAFYLDDDVDADAVARGARELLERTQREMSETAKELWPSLFPRKKMPPTGTTEEQKALVKQVLDALAEDHPTDATIVMEAKEQLRLAGKFVREHDLVGVPDEGCEVIEMPEYRRGVAVAYCDASGPLEEKPETFYAISPTPESWDKKRKRSFYREYNRSMLADLTVHEAMPGHALQLMHGARGPSKLRSVFSSGPFVEGWAVYGEWLMARYGFGGPKVRIMREKMVLRLSVNAILDHGVHAGNMSEAEGIALMIGEAFQEESEAVGKWRRALLTSAQLTTYYYGFTEMMELRDEHEKLPGFTERAFNDRLIGFGAPSLRHLRVLMAPR